MNPKFPNLKLLFQGPDWEYETELPEWARNDWTEDDLV